MELKEAIDTLLKYKRAFIFQTDITNNDYAESVDTALEELDKKDKIIKQLEEDISNMYDEKVVRNILEDECGLSKFEIDEILN